MTQFFKWVSGILHPLLLPFFGILLLFQVGTLAMYPTTYKLYILMLILLITGLLPGLLILYLSKKGIVSDLDVSDRKQRVLPYIIIFVLYLLMVLLLTKTSMPWFVVKLYMGSLLSIVVSFIITLKWKISAHTMAYGCLVGGSFIVCLNQRINPVVYLVSLLLLAGLQATSRVFLKAHTMAQAASGFALGVASVCLIYFLIP